MDISLIIVLVTLLFVVGGFISSEVLLVTLWQAQDKKRRSKFGSRFSKDRSPENCYDDCMTESHWDAGHISSCFAACKA